MKKIYLCFCLMSIVLISVTSSQIINENNEIRMTGGTLTLPENCHVLTEKSIDLNGNGKAARIYPLSAHHREHWIFPLIS